MNENLKEKKIELNCKKHIKHDTRQLAFCTTCDDSTESEAIRRSRLSKCYTSVHIFSEYFLYNLPQNVLKCRLGFLLKKVR